jgi:hypothetical protein
MECWGSRQFVRTRGIVLDTLACGPEVPGSIPEREISLSKKFTHIAHANSAFHPFESDK